MLYFNESDWTNEDKGHLVLHHDHVHHDMKSSPMTHVLPKRGRMVIFLSRTCWHEVQASMIRDRYAFTLWADRAMDGDV